MTQSGSRFYTTCFTFKNKPHPTLFPFPVVNDCVRYVNVLKLGWGLTVSVTGCFYSLTYIYENNVENCQLKIVLMTIALTPVADD